MLGGAAVSVALPFLDCFLNTNGTALASGAPIPVRYGSWFWGLGCNSARWVPKTAGAHYDLPPELEAIAACKDRISILSGYNCPLDGKGNLAHQSGWQGIRSGAVRGGATVIGPSYDTFIADAIGQDTRFRSLEISGAGDPKVSYSYRNISVVNPSEVDPAAFYARVFGPDFRDPNAADFKPDPRVMVRQSVLSAIADKRQKLLSQVGAADRARLDEYFTSLRTVEQQIAMELRKPEPNLACVAGTAPEHMDASHELSQVTKTHDLLARVMVMALACGQTRVFNVALSESNDTVYREGQDRSHHQMSHEEPVDEKLGYQPITTSYVLDYMKIWTNFVQLLDSVKEGDRTLLDNSLVFAHSDTNFAKTHAVDGIPMMLAGNAGGKIKSGIHLPGNGDPVTRVALTIMQVAGVTVDKFGVDSLETSKPLNALLA
jgi:hypothetical protein